MNTAEAVQLNYLPAMPVNREVPIGCIGAGFIMADCHLVAYRNSGFNPVAITSRSKEKREEAAAKHNIKKVYTSWQELVKDPGIEVLDIAVPPDAQLEVIQEAVKQKHIRGILAQKPM